MLIERLRQPGVICLAPAASLALFTAYCQLWATFDGGVALEVSLLWGLINTFALNLFAAPLWLSRRKLVAWVEGAHPANLVAAAGIFFGAAACAVGLSALLSSAVSGEALQLAPLARRLMTLLPFLAAAAVAVTAILTALGWRSARVDDAHPSAGTRDRWIDFPEEPLLRLRTADMAVIRTARNYCELDVAGRSILIRVTAKQLEHRLGPHGFVRIHRGAIVNLSRVRVVQRGQAGRLRLLLDDGSEVAVSKGHRESFTAELAKARRSRLEGRLPPDIRRQAGAEGS